MISSFIALSSHLPGKSITYRQRWFASKLQMQFNINITLTFRILSLASSVRAR
jgi:hypothetical protein